MARGDIMKVERNETYKPIYDESEKEFNAKQSVNANNKVIFDMIQIYIDDLITNRLLDFRNAHPAICSESEPIAYCKN